MIQSPGRWSSHPRADNNPPERAQVHEPVVANQGFNIETLVGLQANELRNLVKILKGFTAARNNDTPTQALPDPVSPAQNQRGTHIPVVTERGEEEAILWYKVGTGHVPPPDDPPPVQSRDGGSSTIPTPLPPPEPQGLSHLGQPATTLM